MAANRIFLPLTVATAGVVAAVGLSSSGLLPVDVATVVDDSAQLAGALAAAVACGWTGLRESGLERSWRLLMALAMGGWSVGQAIWSWYRIFGNDALPSPSWADVGYFMLPVFAFVALLVLAREGAVVAAGEVPGRRRSGWLLVLDGVVVVGSLFVVTWSTALGAVVRAGAPTPAAFAVAIGHLVSDLILVVMVVLLVAAYQGARPRRPQLVLLGLGLIGISVSDSLFAYVVASGAEMPPARNIGFVAGPALIAVAALVHVGGRHRDADGSTRAGEWGYRLVPYMPVLAGGLLVLWKTISDDAVEPIVIYIGMLVVALVVIRQTIALVDNSMLLRQVVDAQERLSYLAFHDPLTGLANRVLFRERLVAAVERARSSGRTIAVLFVDLDGFKVINDSLGHSDGDLVLQAVSERLRSCAGRGATVARLGGDEFGVLLEADIEQARELGEQILAALRQPLTVERRPVTVGASLGVVLADPADPHLTADALIRRADAAMYAGKRRGKGGMVMYEPGIAAALGDPDLPMLLAAALRGGGGFDVHYQPVVQMDDGGATVAVEALARWTHPTLGAVPPDVFVAAAERAGLIGELDNLVLDRACQEAVALAERESPVDVHVNVCASRLCEPELEVAVRAALDRYALSGARLVLEITETSRVPDLEAAARTIHTLRTLGIRFAMDDFGTGYNTLAQLHLLPVDIVKLCQAHTAVDGAERVEALCRSVVSICQSLGLTVIAEGVESASQAEVLARLGCQLGQGYLYGRPAPLVHQDILELPKAPAELVSSAE
jgi:diguanylate cyclase (GGDEF)-like protein